MPKVRYNECLNNSNERGTPMHRNPMDQYRTICQSWPVISRRAKYRIWLVLVVDELKQNRRAMTAAGSLIAALIVFSVFHDNFFLAINAGFLVGFYVFNLGGFLCH